MFKVPNQYRIRTGQYGSSNDIELNGAFLLPSNENDRRKLFVLASDGYDWYHVSVHARIGHTPHTPYWSEMCHVKDIFWDKEDWVMQFHPSKKEYVNNHPHVLHLWQPINVDFPKPDKILVGIPGLKIRPTERQY